jgi:FkbM family methyltransferase
MSEEEGAIEPRAPAKSDSRNQMMQRADAYGKALPTIRFKGRRGFVHYVTPNSISAYRVLTIATKEPETIAWLDTMTPEDVLFDVGANIGLYSLYASVGIGCRVFAFEPEARNFGTLNANIGINKIGDRCLAYCVGISDSSGFSTILLAREELGSSGHQVQGAKAGSIGMGGRETRPQGIQTVSLDELVHVHKFPMPSHIKIDVDGLEHAIVTGGQRVLADPRLKSVMIELALNFEQHRAVIGHLEEFGFSKDAAMEAEVRAKTEGVAHTGNILFKRN